jgi:lysyl-tRNA synthetase class 2
MEVYVDGMELANGYQELTDAAEQRVRFHHALSRRRQRGQPVPPLDQALLDALGHGLPPCAGIALGFDRLAMLSLGLQNMQQVVAFPFSRC